MTTSLAPSSQLQVVTTRDPKGLKFVSIVEAAYNAAGLTDREAQRVNETPGLSDIIAEFISENRLTDRFKDEEVESEYVYPQGYNGPKPISTQIDILAGIFSLSLGNTSEFLNKVLPDRELAQGAEGRFAVASVDAVAARFFPEVKDPAERYVRAVLLAVEKLKESNRPFYNYLEGYITTARLRRHAKTVEAMKTIAEEQTGDILILDAQLGMRHRGRSIRRAREIMQDVGNEFGLGAWEVINIALTHPERFVKSDELDIDCAGDELDLDEDDGFSFSPCLYFDVGRVEFDRRWFDSADDDFGSASAFLSQK